MCRRRERDEKSRVDQARSLSYSEWLPTEPNNTIAWSDSECSVRTPYTDRIKSAHAFKTRRRMIRVVFRKSKILVCEVTDWSWQPAVVFPEFRRRVMFQSLAVCSLRRASSAASAMRIKLPRTCVHQNFGIPGIGVIFTQPSSQNCKLLG
jgi:hypothetical protein